MPQTRPLLDSATQLKDAGLVAASAQTQVGGADAKLDFGAGKPFTEVKLMIDISAIEVASGDEKYEIEFQLSDSPTFASGVVVADVTKVGDSSVTGSSADTAAGGPIVKTVNNEWQGTRYRYARLFTRIAGTVATGINYTAYATQRGN